MMCTTAEQLGAHLEACGVTAVLLPDPDGNDYLVATVDGLTAEVFYTAAEFTKAIVTGPGVNETITSADELARQLGVTGPEQEAEEVRRWFASMLPTPARDASGRIVDDPVMVGDVWACRSLPQFGRTFRITDVADGYCYGIVLTNSGEVQRQLDLNLAAYVDVPPEREPDLPFPNARTMVGDMVKIRLSRMRATADGYSRLSASEA